MDIAEFGQDLTTPPGFVLFDRSNPNHHRYGQKLLAVDGVFRWPHHIKFAFNEDTHTHYVVEGRSDIGPVNYGHLLEAEPYCGVSLEGVDDTQLGILLGDEEQRLRTDIVLNTINDKGVTADVDKYRHLHEEQEEFRVREQELARDRHRNQTNIRETTERLIAARTRSRMHPYLTSAALIPDAYRPSTMRTGGSNP